MAEILIVDDEPQVRKLLMQFLESAGHTCRTAEDVKEAKWLLSEVSFNLILSDIDMPGETGFDLIDHVHENFPDTAMMMVSIIDDPSQAKKALQMGVYGYIVKPFTRNIVLINVENALRRKNLEIENQAYMTKLETLVQQRTQSLKDQLTFFQTLIDAIPSPIFYKNRAGEFKGCNTAFEILVGKKREAINGKTAFKIIPKLMADIPQQTDQHLLKNPGKITYEYDVTYPDNSIHNFLLNKATYPDADGNVAGVAGVMVDITERKAAEEALRVSREKFRNIVENIGIGVAMIGSDGRVLEMNRQMREWFPKADAEKRATCYQLFISETRKNHCHGCPTMKTLATGEVCEATMGYPESADKRSFRIISSPILDRNGKIQAAIELVEDITEKLVMERELHQAQKLEAIGQLAAGIAHEINTPIQYVGDNTRFLKESFEDIYPVIKAYEELLSAVKNNRVTTTTIEKVEQTIETADLPYLAEEVPGAIEQSLEGIQRVSKIIRAMRQFSHPGTNRKAFVDINQALENTITVARNEWKYVADLETDFDINIPNVNCLPGEINQVFLNLIINAAQAIGDFTSDGKQGKGKIHISTRKKNKRVFIRIEDSGGGIPETIQHKIFDPFFTTKPVGKGTGQGLSIAHNVITEKHAGTISFETYKDQGTTFIIELPVGTSKDTE